MRYALFICAICLAAVACGSRSGNKNARPAKPVAGPVRHEYKIVAEYPHDTQAYTQGLLWHDGALVESTGEYGSSTLRRVALETGETEQLVKLSDDLFAEGAALIGDKIYQLTWQEGRCFVYNAATFTRAGEFTYRGEGWGLTTDGTRLYMSDGTPNITVRNAQTFAVEKTIAVRNQGRNVQWINELEWINGRIWANIYMTEEVVIINPDDGKVEGVIDFSGLRSRLDITWSTDVMNGIAWDAASGRIWVTGKNWNKLFEIEIVKQ